MKKTSKRVIAILLTVVISFSVIGLSAASIATIVNLAEPTDLANGSTVINADSIDEAIEMMKSNPDMFKANDPQGKSGGKDAVIYPTVIIPGISQSISYLADENGNPVVNANGSELSGGLLIIDDSQLVSVIANNLAGPLAKALITQSDKDGMLAEGVYKTVTELFAIQSSNKHGLPTHNLKTVSYTTSVAGMSKDDRDYFYRMIPMQSITEEVGEDNLYLYAFPLIGDPMESAKGLNDYIQMVKQQKGVDKVNIVTISLGGTILTAYLELYKNTGYPDINRVVNVVACLDGTDVMGDFYLRKFNLDDDFFFRQYVPMIMKESNGYGTLGYIINIALKIFPKSVIYSILTAAVDGIIDTLMHNCPQFWAMLPSDRYEEAKVKYNEIWNDPTYHILAPKLDAFQTAKLNLKDNLAILMNSGRLVHNVAGYGLDYSVQDYNFFGVMMSSQTTNSDAIIDIDSTTLGATYAKAGTILPDEILFKDNAIISPDGSIDISTCAFPENVWLFGGQHHEVGRNDVVIKLIGKLITGEIKSVNDMPEAFPQFNGNRNTKRITRSYLEEAEQVFDETDKSKYAPEDLVELQAAYDEAQALLQTTICDSAVAEATADRLLNALRRVGKESAEEDQTMNKALEAICKFLDDTIDTVFGAGNGFTDIAHSGPFA